VIDPLGASIDPGRASGVPGGALSGAPDDGDVHATNAIAIDTHARLVPR
jgi:hypothetical protein